MHIYLSTPMPELYLCTLNSYIKMPMAGFTKKKIGIIILAAGSSSRLGKPKQLLLIDGKSLIKRVCEAALPLQPEAVVVVTGAYAEEVQAVIVDLPVHVVFNPVWEEGMASSIRKGLEVLLPGEPDAVIILLCDQVNLTNNLLIEIRDAYLKNSCKLVYCSYGKQIGVPALFDKTIFSELSALKGDTGAKSVIVRHLPEAREIAFPGGEADVDSPADAARLD